MCVIVYLTQCGLTAWLFVCACVFVPHFIRTVECVEDSLSLESDVALLTYEMISRQAYDNSAHKIARRVSLHLRRAFVVCNLWREKKGASNARQPFDDLQTFESEHIYQHCTHCTQHTRTHTQSQTNYSKATKQFTNE